MIVSREVFRTAFPESDKIQGVRIAAGETQPSIEKTAPEVGQMRITETLDLVVVGCFLNLVAHRDDIFLGRRNRSGVLRLQDKFSIGS